MTEPSTVFQAVHLNRALEAAFNSLPKADQEAVMAHARTMVKARVREDHPGFSFACLNARNALLEDHYRDAVDREYHAA